MVTAALLTRPSAILITSRLQKSDVADAGRSTEEADLLGVEAEHLIEREEPRVHHSLEAFE
jgi:hypothetical protein